MSASSRGPSERAEVREEGRSTHLELSRWCTALEVALGSADERAFGEVYRPVESEAQLAVHGGPELQAAIARLDTAIRADSDRYWEPSQTLRHLPQQEEARNRGDRERATAIRADELAAIESLDPGRADAVRPLRSVLAAMTAEQLPRSTRCSLNGPGDR